MRYILFMLVLLLGLAARTSSAQSDTTQISDVDSTVVRATTPDIVGRLNTWQLMTGSQGNATWLVVVTEEKLDEVSTSDPKVLEAKKERDAYKLAHTDSLGASPLMLYVLVVSLPDSHSAYTLSKYDAFGILRDGTLIPSLGLVDSLAVNPNTAGHTFAVFPTMEFRSDDQFYVIFHRNE